MPPTADVKFSASIAENYDRYLGPILLEPYGRDLARRLPSYGLGDVLELACGTGIVTRLLRDRLSQDTRLVATDVSEGMMDLARTKPFAKEVEWKIADATALPFKDESFDVVVCQFGFMFFPDKDKAAKEIFRVLRRGGRLIFNVWDRMEHNDFPRIAHEEIGKMFNDDPPAFYQLPFGYYDHFTIRTTLRNAGFIDVALATVEIKAQATPADAAIGCVQGNPIAQEISGKLGKDLGEATERVRNAIAAELGQNVAKGHARAIVVGARKPMAITVKPAEPEKAAAKEPTQKKAPKPVAKKAPAKQPKPVAKAKPATA